MQQWINGSMCIKIFYRTDGFPEIELGQFVYYHTHRNASLGKSGQLKKVVGNYSSVTGDTLPIIGKLTLTFYLGNFQLTSDIIVMNSGSFPGDILMGFFTMRDLGVVLHVGSLELEIDGRRFPLINLCENANVGRVAGACAPYHNFLSTAVTNNYPIFGKINTNPHNDMGANRLIAFGKATQSVTFPRHVVTFIHVFVPPGYATAVSLPGTSKVKGLDFESSLYAIDGNTSSIIIGFANLYDKAVTVRKGAKLLKLELFNDILAGSRHWPVTVVVSTVDETGAMIDQFINKDTIHYTEALVSLHKLIHKYHMVIPNASRPLTTTPLALHDIELVKGARPVYIPSYRLPHARKEAVDKLFGILQYPKAFSAPFIYFLHLLHSTQ